MNLEGRAFLGKNIKFNFKGKTCLVTGAGKGLGWEVTKMFIKTGANVVCVSRTLYPEVAEELRSYGDRVSFIKADVSIEAEVKQVIKVAIEKYKRVDILINNAGIAQGYKVEDLSVEGWDRVMAVNVRSQFLCIREVLPFMKNNRYGKIVNVSSIAGRDKSIILGSPYSTSKAAIMGLTRAVASEVAPFNINVNCICPSQHRTPMLKEVLSPDIEKKLLQKIPLGYIAEPEQIANVILFLASDEANYMSGSVVDVNGGQL